MPLIKPVSKHGGSRCVVIDRAVLALVHIDPDKPINITMGPGSCFRLRAPGEGERGRLLLVDHGNAKALSVPADDFNSVGIDPDGRAEILVEDQEIVIRCPMDDRPTITLYSEEFAHA